MSEPPVAPPTLGTVEPVPASGIVVFVDGDACPVKEEVFRVAGRNRLPVYVVANSWMRLPQDPLVHRVVVPAGPDVADDWIVSQCRRGAIVVTSDIPLASRSLKAGADAVAPNGRAFTESSIGMALATRNLMDELRSSGEVTGGPKPFAAKDRSAFLSALDVIVQRLKRAGLS